MTVRKSWMGFLAVLLTCAAGCRSGETRSESTGAAHHQSDRLTPARVETYLAVRKRTVEILELQDAAGALDLVFGLPAAQSAALDELGQDVVEFRRIAAMVEASRSAWRPSRLDGIVTAIARSSRAGVAEVTGRADEASRAHNRSLLERYDAELAALDSSLAALSPGDD